jgi:hypothetical protein
MTVLKKLAAAALVAALPALSACGGSDSTPASTTAPTVVTGPSTELFEGTITPAGSAFYSFTVTTTGLADVMLASVTSSASPGTSSTVVLGLALGTPLGTDCTITNSLPASAGLTSQLVNSLSPGIYCARVYDIGNLRSTVNFAIRIVHT